MLYIIGLGLNVDGISKFGLQVVKKCKKIYLENYTVEFPYSVEQLKEVLGKKIHLADREFVESLELVDEAKKMDVALLVYGSPLTATTHISLLQEAKKSNVRYKIIYNASVFDAVAETGLQIYKFGKITSMPKWDREKDFTPDSFMKIVQENQSMKAHSLILVDIGLKFSDALHQLKESAKTQKIKLDKILVCSKLGAKGKRIFYRNINDIKSDSRVNAPYCFIIPSKLHFLEKEVLEEL
jgi:diphthine synthase